MFLPISKLIPSARKSMERSSLLNFLTTQAHLHEEQKAAEVMRKIAGKNADIVLVLVMNKVNFNEDIWREEIEGIITKMSDPNFASSIILVTLQAACQTERDNEFSNLLDFLTKRIAKVAKNQHILPAVQNAIGNYCFEEKELDKFTDIFTNVGISLATTTVAKGKADVLAQEIYLHRLLSCLPPPSRSEMVRIGGLANSRRFVIYQNIFKNLRKRNANDVLLNFFAMLHFVDPKYFKCIREELIIYPRNFGINEISDSRTILQNIDNRQKELETIKAQQEEEQEEADKKQESKEPVAAVSSSCFSIGLNKSS